MSWISDMITGSASGLIEGVANAADKFITTSDEKQEFKLKVAALQQARDEQLEQSLRKDLDTKAKIIVAEMQQGDIFTKRARPMVVYVGLGVIVINYCIAPILFALTGAKLPVLNLPFEFWTAWGGITATWSVGRTFEKRGGTPQKDAKGLFEK